MLRLEYVPLSQVKLWDNNPKKHDLQAIAESIEKYGFRDPPQYSPILGGLVAGNGRTQALLLIKAKGSPPPSMIAVDKDTGEWAMPILFGNDFDSVQIATSYAIDHNNLTLGTMDAVQVMQIWDADGYLSALEDLADYDGLPITVSRTDLAFLMEEMIEEDGGFGGGPGGGRANNYEIVVMCQDEDDMRDTLDRLIADGYDAIIR